MKKVFSLVLVASFLLVPNIVSAQDSVDSRKTFIQKTQTTRQEVKESLASREGEKKENTGEIRKSVIKNFFVNMIRRFEAAVERLNQILARIESRVAKIKSENPSIDLARIDSQIASVKTDLGNTQVKIDTLKSDFDKAIISTNPGESFKAIKEDTTEIKKDLENIKRNLSKIIGEIKGLRVGQSKE